MENQFAAAPVALFVFARPDHTRAVIRQIRQARPAILLVVGDGPRPNHPADRERCAEVRRIIEREVDWNPRLLTLFSETNLGCRQRISSGLHWVFQQVKEAIILEDDCLPDPTFFRYCGELLHHYADDARVGCISGDNFQPQPFACGASYYFSKYNHCWGWATWRRAWSFYDDTMSGWPELKAAGWLQGVFSDAREAAYWTRIFDTVHRRELDTWDYVWTYSCWAQSFLSILPKINLVANIGFGSSATHTTGAMPPWLPLSAQAMPFPLRHPPVMVVSHAADQWSQKNIFGSAKSRGLVPRLQRLFRKGTQLPGRIRRMFSTE